MNDNSPRWTRRRFLEAVGMAGGAAAVYEAMTVMGLLPTPQAFAGPPNLPANHGNGQKVIILGAGIAGLTAGYELLKAGYDVTILEANKHAGGRSKTVRRGDVIEETTGTKQVCMFDDNPHFYLNAGPGRLPYHHRAILHYCNVLGVDLEVYTMMSRANFYQRDESWRGKSVVNRRIANDTRGWIAELLAKAVRRGSLDADLSGVDKDGFLSLLSSFGDVDPEDDYTYLGSSRSGYVVQPGVDDCGKIVRPLTLNDLVSSEFWKHRFYQAEEYEWQPTLFQPVGGMDKIWHGFLRTPVAKRIRYNAQVIGIYNTDVKGKKGVRVKFAPPGSTQAETLDADWCISTIPMPILARIDNNFKQQYKNDIAAVTFADTCKVGWQTSSRFWETQDWMYGGISYTTDDITQMWYPSWNYFGQKGILTGAYNYDDAARAMAAMPLKQRLETAMKGGIKLHPDFAKNVPIELGLSIAWKQVPFQLGGWAEDWKCDDRVYDRLLLAEGQFYIAGDQLSYLSGWQEGAVLSAHHAINGIAGIETPMPKAAEAPAARKAPSIRRRTQGM